MRLTISLSVCGLLSATAAGAQRVPSDERGRRVQIGDRARIRAVERTAGGRRVDCEGRVTAVVGDTIVFEHTSVWGTCPRRVYEPEGLARAEVSFRNRGSRLAHTVLGLGAGTLLGGATARLLAGDGCRVEGCDDGDFAAAIITFGGAVTGGFVGGLVGLALPAGPEWRALSAATPVRVAGLALRPSVRVALR